MLKTFLAVLGTTVFVLIEKNEPNKLILATKRADIVELVVSTFPSLSKNVKFISKQVISALWNSTSPLFFDLFSMKLRKLEVNKFGIIVGTTLKTKDDVKKIFNYLKNRPQVQRTKI